MKQVIKIRFNFVQRLRVLFGHRVYVVLSSLAIPASHDCYVAENDYLGQERLATENAQ